LASASFGATPSCFRLERDEVGGVKSIFPIELAWDSTDGAEGEWSPEHYDAEIVYFEEKGPDLSCPLRKLLSLRCVIWNYGSAKLRASDGWNPSVQRASPGVGWRNRCNVLQTYCTMVSRAYQWEFRQTSKTGRRQASRVGKRPEGRSRD
jgi:hypothetical protein